jgi:hypothetical protein
MNGNRPYLDPVGFELSKNGQRRIIRNRRARVSSCPRLDRASLAYLAWREQERRKPDAAA